MIAALAFLLAFGADEPFNDLYWIDYELPLEAALATKELQAELQVNAEEQQAINTEFAARRRRIDGLVALIRDTTVSETERALRMAAAEQEPEFGLEPHYQRLRTALRPEAAKRLEQVERQIAGPLGAFKLRRRAEFGVEEQQWLRVAKALPGLHAKTLEMLRLGLALNSPERNAKAEEIRGVVEMELRATQREQWRASQGAPFNKEPMFKALYAMHLDPPRRWRRGPDEDVMKIRFPAPGYRPPADLTDDFMDIHRLDSTETPLRPLHLAAVRDWLGLDEAQKTALEELETARDAYAEHVQALADVITGAERKRLVQADYAACHRDRVFVKQVERLLGPKNAQNFLALYLRGEGPFAMFWPTMSHECKIARDSDLFKTINQALDGVGPAVAKRVKNSPHAAHRERMDAVWEDVLNVLPPELRKKWQVMIKLDPMPPESLWEQLTHYTHSRKKPRERHGVALPKPTEGARRE